MANGAGGAPQPNFWKKVGKGLGMFLMSGSGAILGFLGSYYAQHVGLINTVAKLQTPAGFNEVLDRYLEDPDYGKIEEIRISNLLQREDPKKSIDGLIDIKLAALNENVLVGLGERIGKIEGLLESEKHLENIKNELLKIKYEMNMIRTHIAVDNAAECCKDTDNVLKRWCITVKIGGVDQNKLFNDGIDEKVANEPCLILHLKGISENDRKETQRELRVNHHIYVARKNDKSTLKTRVNLVEVWGNDDSPRYIALANPPLFHSLGLKPDAGEFDGIIYVYTAPKTAVILSEYHPMKGWTFSGGER